MKPEIITSTKPVIEANPISKVEEANGVVAITVQFLRNGQVITTEVCRPQDSDGYEYWLKARLNSIETGEDLKADTTLINNPVTLDSFKVVDERTPDEIEWFRKLNQLNKSKMFLSDLGLTIGTEELDALRKDIESTYLPEYFNKI